MMADRGAGGHERKKRQVIVPASDVEKFLVAPPDTVSPPVPLRAAAPLVAVVDDDAGVRGSLGSLLRSVGLESLLFAGGQDLLACDDLDRITCIVTDLHMPGMTGIELHGELVRQGIAARVIVMTAYPTDAARRQALDGGAQAFLAKPVDPDALLLAIGINPLAN